MPFKILCDSVCDLTPDLKKKEYIFSIPLSILIEGETIVDDESFNQAEFLQKMKNSPECPKSACPSPDDYLKNMADADEIFMVTISANLSGSYNSAKVAEALYLEEHPDTKIHVFDSCSASSGEYLLTKMIVELKEAGASFPEVVEKVSAYSKEKKTKFVLESLDTLRKNGRLTGIKGLLAEALNIKPIMGATIDGQIEKIGQARGINKAIKGLADFIINDAYKPEERALCISHCNNFERALKLKELVAEKVKFKTVYIIENGGVSTLYANEGGIIVAY